MQEELTRVIPVVSMLAKELPVPVSIDTTKHEVARAALDAGVGMINDISGLHWDLKLADMAAKYKVPVVIMHTKGKPKTMQQAVHYRSLFSDIIRYLEEGIEIALTAGVPEDQIIVDPGIGFGKTAEDNLQIMNRLFEFSVLGKPILLGTSRKSFIGKVLNVDTDQRLEGTLATTIYGILRGASIIRVHDVKANVRAIRMLEQMIVSPGIDW
jgi:dihydropteroate synthase